MNRVEHLLWILAEECAEVAQRVSKAARFTLCEVQPDQQFTNAERIMHEYCDLLATLQMLEDEGALRLPADANERIEIKRLKVAQFLLLSAELGTLEVER